MAYILEASIIDGKEIFSSPKARAVFLRESNGKIMYYEIREKVSLPEKTRMNKYYHGPVISALEQGFRERGYLLPKGALKLHLEELFANQEVVEIPKLNGETETRIITKPVSSMTKDELRDLITNSIVYIQGEFGIEAPDPNEYWLRESTGRNLTRLRNDG